MARGNILKESQCGRLHWACRAVQYLDYNQGEEGLCVKASIVCRLCDLAWYLDSACVIYIDVNKYVLCVTECMTADCSPPMYTGYACSRTGIWA